MSYIDKNIMSAKKDNKENRYQTVKTRPDHDDRKFTSYREQSPHVGRQSLHYRNRSVLGQSTK